MKTVWTPEEEARLAEMKAEGLKHKDIADALGRSKKSVDQKCARLREYGAKRAAEEADKLSAVTYCDDPHRPEEINAEDDLMKEVCDVIDRLNTLSDALAGTSEFMEQLAEGQKIITEDHIEEARNVKALRIDLDTACGEIGRLHDRLNSITIKLAAVEATNARTAEKFEAALRDVHDLNTYMKQGRIWRLFHSFRSFQRGAKK